MAYTPTIWQTGDTITEDKLNKIEQGILANSDYDNIDDKPSINGNELVGDKSTAELGIDHVAFADNLMATTGVSSSDPYLFRKSPNSVSAELHRLVGGTVAWNQLMPTKTLNATSGVMTCVSNNDGLWTVTLSSAVTTTVGIDNITNLPGSVFTANHIYLWLGKANGDGIRTYLKGYQRYSNSIFKATSAVYNNIALYAQNTPAGTYRIFPMLIDLTLMFGSTIAEALLAMGASDAVTFFRSLFPSAYYPYSAPTLQSVQTSARVARGFNQWDEEWEVGGLNSSTGATTSNTDRIRAKNYIPVIAGQEYCIHGSQGGGLLCYYDAGKNFISSATASWATATGQLFTPPSGTVYLRFCSYNNYSATYLHDICINLSSDRNGQYEPYSAKSYPIDDVVLRGIPKLTNGQMSYDGDIYLPSGEVVRRYRVEVFNGTEAWTKSSAYAGSFWRDTGNTHATAYDKGAIICSHLENVLMGSTTYVGGTIAFDGGNKVNINVFFPQFDANTSVDQFKAYLAQLNTAGTPFTVVSLMDSATTESVDPYTEIQSAGETEQFVSESVVPVGNEAFYPEDLTGVVQDLAPLPTTQGTYKLQVTVTNGTPTYSWVTG